MALHLEATATEAGLHQEPLADFILVRTDEVDRGERLRDIDQVWGRALGALMAKDGQQTPIQVCRLPGRTHWTLVVGAHRHFGAEAFGLEYLKAEIVSADRDSRRLREVVENLHRRDLDPLDRAAFLAELVQLKRARAGLEERAYRDTQAAHRVRAVQLEASTTMDTMSMVYGWTKEVGEQLGLTDRTVRRDLELYRGLPPSLVERLRAARHPILGNASQLRALMKLAPAARDQVVETLVGVVRNGRTITSVAAAMAANGDTRSLADPEAKRLSAFIGAFARMGVAERKAALQELAGMLPAPFRLTDAPATRSALSPDHERYKEETLAALDSAREVIDGLVEDDVVPGERGADLSRIASELQLARFTIAGDGVALGKVQ